MRITVNKLDKEQREAVRELIALEQDQSCYLMSELLSGDDSKRIERHKKMKALEEKLGLNDEQ